MSYKTGSDGRTHNILKYYLIYFYFKVYKYIT